MGFGWWCWIIPLDSGEVSAGLTWDSRLFTPPSEGSIAARLKEHILKQPVGKVMFENAEAVENDNCYYKDLAYWSEEVAGDGWTIVGDACGFMDPLYSQGLDYCAHTIYSSYTLLRAYYGGGCVKEGIAKRNKEFKRSYFDWFNALYKDKYWYLGDAELMHAAFLMDVGDLLLRAGPGGLYRRGRRVRGNALFHRHRPRFRGLHGLLQPPPGETGQKENRRRHLRRQEHRRELPDHVRLQPRFLQREATVGRDPDLAAARS